MWGDVPDIESATVDAVRFTSNYKDYGSFMERVVYEWPYSCENALTDYSINRKAWLGHAAVALALNLPEDITRKAWKELTSEQQFLANEEARRFIAVWEKRYRESKNLCQDVESQMLF